jgi:Flp pilus assembly protein TadG
MKPMTKTRSTKTLVRMIGALLRHREGAALIEFAIVVPVLLFLMLGIIEFGIIFHLMSLSTYAANEAARMGKTGNSYGGQTRDAVIENKVKDIMKPWIKNDSELTVTTQSYGSFSDLGVTGKDVAGYGKGGDVVLYTVTLNWPVLTPVLSAVVGANGTVPIVANVLVKNEGF